METLAGSLLGPNRFKFLQSDYLLLFCLSGASDYCFWLAEATMLFWLI